MIQKTGVEESKWLFKSQLHNFIRINVRVRVLLLLRDVVEMKVFVRVS